MPDPAAPGASMQEFYPPAAFYFALSFDAASRITDAAFQEASGIGPEMELEAYREGGENRFVHQLPKGVKSPRLTLKRGIAPADSGLVVWCKKVLEGGFTQRIQPRVVSLQLMDRSGEVVRDWTFANAYPAKWTVSEFRANKNEVAIETVELAYTSSVRGK